MSTYDAECHEEVSRAGNAEPCDRPAVGYRLDEGRPYPVCLLHLRAPYWMTARAEVDDLSAAVRVAARRANN